ncbi:protein-L-histidine N-pros-methyltransferase-like [Anabrus simplex]|uniref:protein-L-histidine N-pros-methyltransferase-like n=1 Tax=Anabrus simplex TaxID=316456 RepID=UPI0035A2EB6B
MNLSTAVNDFACENGNCLPECSSNSGYDMQPIFDGGSFQTDTEVLRRLYRPHGTLARTLYLKYLADERLQRFDRNQWYKCETSSLPESVRSRFLPLAVDRDTENFLKQATHKSDWVFTQIWHSVAKSVLRWFMTQTSING